MATFKDDSQLTPEELAYKNGKGLGRRLERDEFHVALMKKRHYGYVGGRMVQVVLVEDIKTIIDKRNSL